MLCNGSTLYSWQGENNPQRSDQPNAFSWIELGIRVFDNLVAIYQVFSDLPRCLLIVPDAMVSDSEEMVCDAQNIVSDSKDGQ